MTDHGPRAARWDWMSPSAERLRSKFTNLEELQREFRARKHSAEKEHALEICEQFLRKAKAYLDRPAISLKCPFFSRKHPHLVWEYLHRVDEYHILLLREEEIYNKAIEVRTDFDLNIKEEKTRSDWIGPKGRLVAVLDHFQKRDFALVDIVAVKDALNIVNEQADRTFWQLSANTLTNVWSAMLLGLLMALVYWQLPKDQLAHLGSASFGEDYKTLIVLGLMGSYVGNLLSTKDFLYVRGGPFFRYFLHNVMTKPLMGAFAAVFIYVVEKSKLLFSISTDGAAEASKAATQLITLHVQALSVPYVYAVLAITSAFAADRLLRSTFDSVLNRLEQKAEKTKDSGKD